ncbi:ABC transporter ATP-binding protein [Parvularcula sp. ZS-1/3]|uniref:ABC transporter ATP-binding protein n=1 Tax=Parvularcula mediterranea TaxID=2732508 RepID=A0A7Y3RMK8_9PROT|nr:ABC transporter ATP-binding protein [Parvularcula mediterranea]NNU16765.1 ABC transporter ATP-binding protein [Parvularcula mediterranea]
MTNAKFLSVKNVSKSYKTKVGWNQVLRNVSFSLSPRDRLGILGRNGAGKSTLLRIVGGAELPDTGLIEKDMSVSWPVGFSGHLQPAMSGRANVKFCARVYNREVDEVVDFVSRFSELGSYLEEPVRTYSSGMKARLGFSLSMAIDFDCLLIDEVTAVGDAVFRKKCEAALLEVAETRSFIMVNHGLQAIDRLCNRVIVLGVEDEPVLSTRVHKTIKAYEKALLGGEWQRVEE